MEFIIVALFALFASLLTFFSGFGLGTILMPVFAIFFPIEVAIALTGIVHLLNNLFKITLVGNKANWNIVLKFGVPAIISAFIGAWILMFFSADGNSLIYYIGERKCVITPIKILVALLMFTFAVLELLPLYKRLSFSENKLLIGGAVSGFFGGLSGHQGALRSIFLVKCGLTKEGFIATGVIIASVVDISRISVYFTKYSDFGLKENMPILLTAITSAFVGAVIGKKLLKKITIGFVNITVTILIMLLSVLLGFGII